MPAVIEKIEHEGELLALILRASVSEPGVSFFTPPDLSQQLAYISHPTSHVIAPHDHLPVPREDFTQEVLLIRRGRLRVDFYDQDRHYLESRDSGARRRDPAGRRAAMASRCSKRSR